MYDEPELIDVLLGYIVDYYFGVSQRIFDAAADLIDIFFIGNDFGGKTGPLMGDKHVQTVHHSPSKTTDRSRP